MDSHKQTVTTTDNSLLLNTTSSPNRGTRLQEDGIRDLAVDVRYRRGGNLNKRQYSELRNR